MEKAKEDQTDRHGHGHRHRHGCRQDKTKSGTPYIPFIRSPQWASEQTLDLHDITLHYVVLYHNTIYYIVLWYRMRYHGWLVVVRKTDRQTDRQTILLWRKGIIKEAVS